MKSIKLSIEVANKILRERSNRIDGYQFVDLCYGGSTFGEVYYDFVISDISGALYKTEISLNSTSCDDGVAGLYWNQVDQQVTFHSCISQQITTTKYV